jgi:hypothetical protein
VWCGGTFGHWSDVVVWQQAAKKELPTSTDGLQFTTFRTAVLIIVALFHTILAKYEPATGQ